MQQPDDIARAERLDPAEAERIAASYGVEVPEDLSVRKFPRGHTTLEYTGWQRLGEVAHRIRARQRKFMRAAESARGGIDHRIIEMRANGRLYREISLAVGLSVTAVHKRAQRLGLVGTEDEGARE